VFAVDLADSKHDPLMEERQHDPDGAVLEEADASPLTVRAQAEGIQRSSDLSSAKRNLDLHAI
jgi:hypothetical protein